MLSNSRSWASGGKYASSPSALQAVGCAGSNPLSRSAAGQSSRRSTPTALRSAFGAAPKSARVRVLNSITWGWSTSKSTAPAGFGGVQEEGVEEAGADRHSFAEPLRSECGIVFGELDLAVHHLDEGVDQP